MDTENLSDKTIDGAGWLFFENGINQVFNFLVSIILARLLLPEDFGLVGIVLSLFAITRPLLDGDMASSLIRSQDLKQNDYNTVFTFNLFMALLLYVVLYAIAPFMASYYELPELKPVTRVLALTGTISTFTTIQMTVLTKEMMFKKKVFIRVPALLISGGIAIYLAYEGFGAWALVYRIMASSVIILILCLLFRVQRFGLGFDRVVFKKHFRFGINLMLSRMVNAIFANINTFIIAKFYSANELGLYTRAVSFRDLPVKNLSSSLNTVTYSALSKLNHDDDLLRNAYLKLFRVVFFVLAPVLAAFIWGANEIFVLLFTHKWDAAIPYFQLLCIAGLFQPFNSYNLNILKVKGRSDLYLRVELVKKIIVAIGLYLLYKIGVIGLVYFQIGEAIVFLFMNSYFSGRLINLPIVRQFKEILANLTVLLILGVIIVAAEYFVLISSWSLFLSLLFKLLIVAMGYWLLSKALNRKVHAEVWGLFSDKLNKLLKKLKHRAS